MVRALNLIRKSFFAGTAIFLLFAHASFAQEEDPPYRVARLNYFSGNVSMQPAGVDQWAPADLNRPFTIGDYLYTDQGARAELHLDDAAMRLGPQTSFGFLNLNDQVVQIKLTEGDMYFRIHNLSPDQSFEIDTPNAAVTLLRDGEYRFRVDPNGSMSFVVVRNGQAQITGGGQAFTLNPGNSALLTGTDQLSYDIEGAPNPDDFDNWCAARDAHEAHLASARYLPPTIVGYEDLDDYGGWQQTGDYGPVWYPNQVAVGWAPYHNGHWAWVEPWGWTWVDDMPWGFAPFHYGRWAYIGGRWGWCPGPIAVEGYRGPVVRPYYAPAMVAWFGGAHFGIGISIGGPSLGWVPLGFGEVYTPSYVCSRNYFRNVNVYNTRVVNTVNITNVYNTVYVDHRVYNQQIVNMRAPNAVMAMPQTAFASGRPVTQAGFAVRQADVARLQTAAVMAPPVAPTRQAVLPNERPVPHPLPQYTQRQVVARNQPPAPPAAFAVRQQYLQQHAGQPHNFAAMHQAFAAQVQAPNVRQAPAAQPVQVHAGERVGNVGAYARSSAPSAPQPNRAVEPLPAPAAPVHGVPPNVRQPAPRQEGVQPPQNTRSAERTFQEQPNMRERSQPPAQPQPRPQPAYGERQATQPASAAPVHGVPPNVHQPAPRQEGVQPPQNTRSAERTFQEQPNMRERSQPPAQQQPRPQQQYGERPAPQSAPVAHPAERAPQQEPNMRERTQPQPQARPEVHYPERSVPQQPRPETQPPARPEPRPEAAKPAPRPEAKPAAPAHEGEHRNPPPKDDHKGR
ncbi:MAG: FecR domain-containing protein [Acidobacteriaceae bacterium]|nr:FecR domain-containing protein [Acidobacteriaceae bacterium]